MPRSDPRAFTLVEFMIASALLVLGVAAIYDQFIQTRDLGRRQFDRVEARQLARQIAAELEVCSHKDLAAWSPPADYDLLDGQTRFYSRAELKPRPSDGAIEITVFIGWNPKQESAPPEFESTNFVVARGIRYP